MAPTTRNQTREPEPEPGALSSSSNTLIAQPTETMSSATQPTEAQQLAEAREQVRLLQEQLGHAQAASQRSTPSSEGPYNPTTVKLKDPDPLTDSGSPTFEN